MPMKKKNTAGFLDINMEREWRITRLKGGKKEKVIVKRRRELQNLLELLLKRLGPPCRSYAYGCCVCEAYLSFTRLDELLVKD